MCSGSRWRNLKYRLACWEIHQQKKSAEKFYVLNFIVLGKNAIMLYRSAHFSSAKTLILFLLRSFYCHYNDKECLNHSETADVLRLRVCLKSTTSFVESIPVCSTSLTSFVSTYRVNCLLRSLLSITHWTNDYPVSERLKYDRIFKLSSADTTKVRVVSILKAFVIQLGRSLL